MRIAIVGGGIAGMSLDYYLAKQGHTVTIYEKEKNLGGLARSFSVGRNFLEEYYHHIFLSDIYTIKLIEELGLKDKITWEESKMGLYCEGKVYGFGTPFDLFRFNPLTFMEKIRFALSTLYLQSVKDYEKLETISAEEFLLKTAGPNAYKKIWEPLLATKFGDEHYKEVTAAWFQARIKARGKSKNSNFEREKLGYLDGSLKRLFDELEKNINSKPDNVIKKGACVERIDLDQRGRIIVYPSDSEVFDAACLCVPNPVIIKIAGHLFENQYVTRLESIKYRAALCVVLIINKSLSPYYWINISHKGIPFTGLMEHTNLISKDKYGEDEILYLSRYISPEEKQYNMKDDKLIDFYSEYIKNIFPEFEKSIIKKYFVFRDLYAQPIVTKGHKDRMPDAVSSIKNIFINNTSQIYPDDRGMSPGIKKSLELSLIINNLK